MDLAERYSTPFTGTDDEEQVFEGEHMDELGTELAYWEMDTEEDTIREPELETSVEHDPLSTSMEYITDAAGATTDNGHAYFRKSPWASSDILMTLMFDLEPNERGLVQDSETLIWSFPADYIQRLRNALLTIRPDTNPAPSQK